MKSLKEKIIKSKELANKIQLDHPEICSITMHFFDVPYQEIEDYSKEINDQVDVVKRDGKDLLRLLCTNGNPLVLFAYSGPVRVLAPNYTYENDLP
mgnify:CR=1 FL=1